MPLIRIDRLALAALLAAASVAPAQAFTFENKDDAAPRQQQAPLDSRKLTGDDLKLRTEDTGKTTFRHGNFQFQFSGPRQSSSDQFYESRERMLNPIARPGEDR